MNVNYQNRIALANIIVNIFQSPLVELSAVAWQFWRQLWNGRTHEGIYKVLKHEVTLELLDTKGKKAKIQKHQKVEFQQNNVIAYQDQGWGDGEIFVDYQCSPGKVADQYQIGSKQYILISLRKVMNRGDVENLEISWNHLDGYTRSTEQWETEISHKTDKLKLKIIFPLGRPARKIYCSERLRKRTKQLEPEAIGKLPDGRQYATFEVNKPRLYEGYGFHWEWESE